MRSLLAVPILLLPLSACSSELEVSPPALPDGTVGQPFEALVTVSNNDTPLGGGRIIRGAMPPGLSMAEVENDDTLPIRGVPEQAGSFSFELELWCYATNFSGQSAARKYDIDIR
jgi:hypothetical protein